MEHVGVDLVLLRKIFAVLDASALRAALEEKPTSSHLRRLWFF
jgi:hypothetical protein